MKVPLRSAEALSWLPPTAVSVGDGCRVGPGEGRRRHVHQLACAAGAGEETVGAAVRGQDRVRVEGVSVAVLKVACPLAFTATAALATTVLPSRNVTVPAVALVPLKVRVTVAMRATDWP